MKKRRFPNKKFTLYVNEDGSQYLPENETLFAPMAELPEGVESFSFSIKVLPASFSINSSKALTTMMIESQLQGGQIKSADTQQKLAMEELLYAIAEWDYVDESGKPIPISLESVADIEPGWIFDYIRQAHESVNSAKNLRRT